MTSTNTNTAHIFDSKHPRDYNRSDDQLKAVSELLERCRDNRVLFCIALLNIEPHPGQVRWLINAHKRENFLVTGNRFGKSFGAGMTLITDCMTQSTWSKEMADFQADLGKPYKGINIALTQDQANLVWQKALQLLSSPKNSWMLKHEPKMTPYPKMTFINDAELESRNTGQRGEHLLGHDFDVANWDETAYEPNFNAILDNVLRMRLVDRNGRLYCTTTGNGRNDFGKLFLNILEDQNKAALDPAYVRKFPQAYAQTGTSKDNPYIDKQALEDTAAKLPPHLREQNIYGGIIDLGGDYFSNEDLLACTQPRLTEATKVLAWQEEDPTYEAHTLLYANNKQPYYRVFPNHSFVSGWDLGKKRDYVVGTTFDTTTRPFTLVELEMFRRKNWNYTVSRINNRYSRYHGKTMYDGTGLGDVVGDMLDARIGAEGFVFTTAKKIALLENASRLINLREVSWPHIKVLFDQMSTYREEDEDLQTDIVMSILLALYLTRATMMYGQPAAINVTVPFGNGQGLSQDLGIQSPNSQRLNQRPASNGATPTPQIYTGRSPF